VNLRDFGQPWIPTGNDLDCESPCSVAEKMASPVRFLIFEENVQMNLY